MNKFIPVAAPVLNGNEKKYVMDCLSTTWISSTGKYITGFENEFAKYCGVKHAVACFNGTVALHLAMLALNIGEGDEVILPTFTYVASANSVLYTGATPVFVDAEPQTWNIDVNQIEKHITPRTKAILVVHIYGHPADVTAIKKIADKHGLYIIEDAAEAHGAMIGNTMVGSMGNIGTFSFFGNKIITTGEGGMITTNDDAIAAHIRQLKGQGMDPSRRYWFPILGYNYRMTNIQAAIGLAQLENINWHLEQRQRIAGTYKALLAHIPEIKLHPELEGFKNSYWMTSIVLDSNLDRDTIMVELFEKGIETRPFFFPMHTLPMYAKLTRGETFPVADHVSAHGMNLPSSASLTEADIQYICDCLVKVLSK